MVADALLVLDAWRFCGGWAPDRALLYCELHAVDDPMLLLELLQHLRDLIAEA